MLFAKPDISRAIAVDRSIDLIVVHCSATPSCTWLAGRQRTAVDVIDDWHLARGFQRSGAARNAWNWRLRAVGYHYVVDVDGYLWTGRHPGEVGAHVAGHNARSLGICLVGGAERDAQYTAEQWAALAQLVGSIKTWKPDARVCGHRDLSPDADGDGQVEPHEWLKTCPGFDVQGWYSRGMVAPAQHLGHLPGTVA